MYDMRSFPSLMCHHMAEISSTVASFKHIYNGIMFPSLNNAKVFESIPDEPQSTSSLAAGQITCAVTNYYTSNEVKCPLLWEF